MVDGNLSFEYEGNISEIFITCEIRNAPIDSMSAIGWSIGTSSNGNPPGLFDFIFDEKNLETLTNGEFKKELRFNWPKNVDRDWEYIYVVTATTDRSDLKERPEASQDVYFGFEVLNKPRIEVDCDNPTALIGSGTLKLSCEANSNLSDSEVPLPNEGYSWKWVPVDHASRIDDDTEIPNPTFNIPDEQELRSQKYEYDVTVSHENADPPETTKRVTITVEYSGVLNLNCEDMEFNEGDEEAPLECRLDSPDPALDPASLRWRWELTDGGGEGQIQDNGSNPPDFYPPESITSDETYVYKVDIESDLFFPSSDEIIITVFDVVTPEITVTCDPVPSSILAGNEEGISFSCSADTEPNVELVNEKWRWESESDVDDHTNLLSSSVLSSPNFNVPTAQEQQESPKTYTYKVTASADNAVSGSASVSVTVVIPQINVECIPNSYTRQTGDESFSLNSCIARNDQSAPLTYDWKWRSGGDESHLDQLTETNISSPIFNVPTAEQQTEPSVPYVYEVSVSAENATSPPQPATVTITVERYLGALTLECPDLEVTVGMKKSEPIQCKVFNDLDEELEYAWEWTPQTLLTKTDTGTPLFAVPSEQRAYSRTYSYDVAVSVQENSELADGAETSVTVTVINPNVESAEDIAISTSDLDLGLVGSGGEVTLDPATEQVSGLVFGGTPHSGRIMIRAQDSVTVSIETPESAMLYHENNSEDQVFLAPDWAYSESCIQFSAVSQSSSTLQARLQPWDCHVIRMGGMVDLVNAEPGDYTGIVNVVLTINDVDEVYEMPVLLSVEEERQVVVLDPTGVRFESSTEPSDALQWSQSISINPQVAVLGANMPSGTFTIHNPSVYPMEVQVSTQGGYRENQTTDRFSVGAMGKLGDMADLITIHPSVVLLLPGETQPVHYSIPEPLLRQMADQGYASLFNFTTTSRSYIEQSRAPLEQQSPQITFQALGVYIPQRGVENLHATIESESDESIIVLIETDSYPFYGDIVVLDAAGSEVGRSKVLVFTRSRVRVDVRSISSDGYTLQFEPYLSDQAIPSSIQLLSDD